MLVLLGSQNDTLDVLVAGSASLDVFVSSMVIDLTALTLTPGNAVAKVTALGVTQIDAGPTGVTREQIKALTLRNTGTSQNVVTVRMTRGGSSISYAMTPAIPLDPGESIQYVDTAGFVVFDSSGRTKNLSKQASATPVVAFDVNGLPAGPALSEDTGRRIAAGLDLLNQNFAGVWGRLPF